jgi:hypothetical protein
MVFLAAGSAMALTPATEIVIPAGARGAGSGSSVWQMDLYLLDPGSEQATVLVYWLERNQDNSSAVPFTVTVPAGEEVVLDDVILNRVGLSNAGGAFRIVADHPIVANSRIYNLQGASTFGQGFEGLGPDVMASAGGSSTSWIAGLQQNSASHSNLFAVAGPSGAEMTVTGLSPAGAQVGNGSFSVPPWGAFYTALAAIVGQNPGDVVLRVEVTSGEAWCAGSRIDSSTGDPFTLAAAVVAGATGFDPMAYAGTWLGEWNNTTFGSSGAASATITVDTDSRTFTMVSDLDGFVFGASDPPPETYTGSYDDNGVSLTATSDTFGTTQVTVTPDGRVSGSSTGVPNPSIDSVQYSGTITPTTYTLDYTVVFSGNSGTAEGVVTMTKQ